VERGAKAPAGLPGGGMVAGTGADAGVALASWLVSTGVA